MKTTHRFVAAVLALAGWTGSAVGADFAFMDDPNFNAAEYKCLAAAIYDGTEELEPDALERAAWVLKNRSASDEYPATSCEMATELEKQGPWTAPLGNELVGEVMRLETGSDAYKAAVTRLEAYRTDVNAYRQAQTAAYKMMLGWYPADPTGGATSLGSEIDEADAEAEAG